MMLHRLERAASGSVLETHPHYRTAIGVLGVSLPLLLMVGGKLLFAIPVQSSISAYYYTLVRDLFVGILWVIGVFLTFYQYHPRQQVRPDTKFEAVREGRADAWLGKAAGISAVIVALFPTEPPPESPALPPEIGWIHGAAAAVLFLCLSLFPLLLFIHSRDYGKWYRGIGWSMIGALAALVAYQFSPESLRDSLAALRPVLTLETALITLFSAGWFLKGFELAKKQREEDQQQRSAA